MAFPLSFKVVRDVNSQMRERFIRMFIEEHFGSIQDKQLNLLNRVNEVKVKALEEDKVVIEHWFHGLFFIACVFSVAIFFLDTSTRFKFIQLIMLWGFYYFGNCYLRMRSIKSTIRRIEDRLARELEAERVFNSPNLVENGICPACGFKNSPDALKCGDCGIIFTKVEN